MDTHVWCLSTCYKIFLGINKWSFIVVTPYELDWLLLHVHQIWMGSTSTQLTTSNLSIKYEVRLPWYKYLIYIHNLRSSSNPYNSNKISTLEQHKRKKTILEYFDNIPILHHTCICYKYSILVTYGMYFTLNYVESINQYYIIYTTIIYQ